MGFLEKVYNKSPIFFQNIMVSMAGYSFNKSRYGKTYHEHRAFLKDYDTWDIEKKLEHQNSELAKFVKLAATNSAFYKELYKGIDIDSIKCADDLKRLPIVDKEMLRKNIDKAVTIPKKGAVLGQTGGTTGKSLVVFITANDMMKKMATLDHFKKRVGFEHRKMRRATFNGKHIVPPNQKKKVFWRYNAACKQMIYSSFNLSEENMKYYVDSFNRYKPDAIDGFFMSMCDVASYIERHNLKLDFIPVAIFPTSETLTASGRELLERVFRCKVYDQYASSEGAPFITECSSQVLHIEPASGVFEHFEDDSDEILVTSFTSHGTPLIRYRIGDEMIMEDGTITTCKCGEKAMVVKQIKGRRLDFAYTAERAKINSGVISNLFKKVPNAVVRAQLIQNELGMMEILIETDKEHYKTEYDDIIRTDFVHTFGDTTKFTITHVDEIPREKSGKFRLVRNNVDAK